MSLLSAALTQQWTGIEISGAGVQAVQVKKDKQGWQLVSTGRVPLSQDCLWLSYKKKNLMNREELSEAVQNVVRQLGRRVGTAGVSIPNEIIRISIQKFESLPKSGKDTERMLAWAANKERYSRGENTKISYHRLDPSSKDEHMLLITSGLYEVIREYEMLLKSLKIDAAVIRPSGINQYNYYRGQIPIKGIVAFLGLYENYFTFFVFENGRLTFYHGVKRGFSDLHFFQDVDMTMQHYMNANPEKEIESIYVGSQVGFHRELEDVFHSLSDMDIHVIDERKMMAVPAAKGEKEARELLSLYASAIGAAQSLAE